MKKIIILALMLAVCGWLRSTQAQYTEPDTLWGLSDKFFTNFWPPRDWEGQNLRYFYHDAMEGRNYYCWVFGAERYGHRVLKQFHTDDSIRVIGIGITFRQFDEKAPIMDSVLMYAADSMGHPIYKWAHEWDASTAIAHRLMLPMDVSYPNSCHQPPVGPSSWGYTTYYMENPVVVKDTFYIGFTQYNDRGDDSYEGTKHIGYYRTAMDDDCTWPLSTHLYSDSVDGPWLRCDILPWVFWVWPLIDVDYQPYTEDTTATDTTQVDTTGILGVQDREWVSVWPNPAQDRVVVEAESPIQQITVTNIQGQNIYDDRHRSAKVVLNCSWWPRGAYFVKFRTETDPALRVRKILVE